LLHKRVENETISSGSRHTKETVKTKLKDIALSGYRSYLPPQSCFSKQEFKTLKDLQKDDTIVIIKPDKGNGIVVLDRTDYISKMHDILSDENKFVPMIDDPVKTTIKREDKVQTFLKRLKNNGVISEEIYKKLVPTGSRPGILYGLPKIHKHGIPLRPILSAIKSHSYSLAKFWFLFCAL
jgi:hypothetical protein